MNTPFRVDSQVSQLYDKGQFFPDNHIYRVTETGLVNQGLQVVFIGHFHGSVGGIDPFDCQLQSLPAAHGTHGRSGGIDFFRLGARRSKKSILGLCLKKCKIGQKMPPAHEFILMASGYIFQS